jgi:DNA-binding MarR family transcriptional regulator
LLENLKAVKVEEQDHIDRWLESEFLEEIPHLDLTVEGIVDRINGLSRRFKRSLEKTVSEHGLSYADWTILGTLSRGGPRRSAGELAEKAELSSGAMTNRLDRLEEGGLVRRVPDPNDRRGVLVELTAKGKRAWNESTGAEAAKEALIAAALSEREKEQLNALLRRLMLEFERRESAPPPPPPPPPPRPRRTL